MRVSILAVMTVLLVVAGAACDSGGASNGTATAGAGAVAFDPNSLIPLVVQPSEAPAGLQQTGFFNGTGTSYASVFGGPSIRIQTSVTYFEDQSNQDKALDHDRRVFIGYHATEANLPLPGKDVAFSYTVANPPNVNSLAVHGKYLLLVQIASPDGTDPAAKSIEDLARYNQIMIDHIVQYTADPSSITPVAGVPTYDAPAATATAGFGSPAETPTP